MFKEYSLLCLVLVSGFVAWGFYQQSQWPYDFNAFQPETYQLAPVQNTYKQHFNPTYLLNATVITDSSQLTYPEDLVVTNDGTIYTGLVDGSIVQINAAGKILPFYKSDTSGRVYGMILTSDQSTIYYLCQYQGLIKFDILTKKAEVLLKEIDGQLLVLNSAGLDQENQVLYITRSTIIPMDYSNKQILLQHRKGSIISFDLTTHKVQTILSDLAFPNGIVFQKSTKSIIFSELNRHRIVRYDLTTKSTQIILQNLFGYGDNLKLNEKGQLLVAIPGFRDQFLDFLHTRPAVRKFMMNWPEPLLYACCQKFTGGIRLNTKTGEILQYFNFATTKISFLGTILEKKGKLYLCSLRQPTIVIVNPLSIQEQAQNIEL